jgi:hypothetical protein
MKYVPYDERVTFCRADRARRYGSGGRPFGPDVGAYVGAYVGGGSTP